MRPSLSIAILFVGASLVLAGPGHATEAGFSFKAAHRGVTADPDGVWAADAVGSGGVSIFEYELRRDGEDLLVSQIWNEACSANTCPTRLVRIGADGRRTVLVDDMMHQVIPPNDPRFADLIKTAPQKEFARYPFRLSADGKTLVNGDYRFEIGRARP